MTLLGDRPPLRCRLGMHRWLALSLSLTGARARNGISFCRDCPALKRPLAPNPQPLP